MLPGGVHALTACGPNRLALAFRTVPNLKARRREPAGFAFSAEMGEAFPGGSVVVIHIPFGEILDFVDESLGAMTEPVFITLADRLVVECGII
jgi:hypothetical protein